MWISLKNSLINTNALSEIIIKKVNDGFAIEFYRLDGSFLISTVYETPMEAEADFQAIKQELVKRNKINQAEFEKLWENDDDVCWDFPIIAKKKGTENNSEKDEELEGE